MDTIWTIILCVSQLVLGVCGIYTICSVISRIVRKIKKLPPKKPTETNYEHTYIIGFGLLVIYLIGIILSFLPMKESITAYKKPESFTTEAYIIVTYSGIRKQEFKCPAQVKCERDEGDFISTILRVVFGQPPSYTYTLKELEFFDSNRTFSKDAVLTINKPVSFLDDSSTAKYELTTESVGRKDVVKHTDIAGIIKGLLSIPCYIYVGKRIIKDWLGF